MIGRQLGIKLHVGDLGGRRKVVARYSASRVPHIFGQRDAEADGTELNMTDERAGVFSS
jgi:hypothetical protein